MPLKTFLEYRTHVAMGHFLPGYDGVCAEPHGHTYYLDVTISGPVDEQSGMIMDFHELTRRLDSVIPDHGIWNNSVENPTAENIATWLFDVIDAALEGSSCRLVELTVWEGTTDTGVKVRCES